MMVCYKMLKSSEIDMSLFKEFKRFQEVKRCWRKEEGQWILKDIQFTEEWTSKEYEFLVTCLKNTVELGGAVFGAFENHRLIGFASVENEFFGALKEYIQLSCIHVSYESRGREIGRNLFELISEKAKAMGGKKLYISAHSSEESQKFYKKLGCVEAIEYNEKLVAEEPCDCQLEYDLTKKR